MVSMWSRISTRRTAAALVVLLVALPASYAQEVGDDTATAPPMAPAAAPPNAPLLSPEQLSNMLAPIALYPDPLLSQVLAASTYPLEIVEANQWLAENRGLQGTALMDAARQQNWDPSVQALVAFPDTLRMLASDVRWTTDLGNAFLAQQADVMSAVQGLRARARENGKLRTTEQQVVNSESQGGQTVIEIVPADPQVIYVPVYQPSYVWGAPAWGYYPDLWYPSGFGFGFGFGPGLYMSSYFPSWGGWGGWGWNCGWFGHGLYLNFSFFNHYGYRGAYYGGYRGYWDRGYRGRAAWSHNPGHRMGVAYPSRVAGRYDSGRGDQGLRNGGNWNNRYNSPHVSNGFTGRNGSNSTSNWRGSGDRGRGSQGMSSGGRQSESARGSGGWRSFANGGRNAAGGGSSSTGNGFRGGSRGSGTGSGIQASPRSSGNGGAASGRSYSSPYAGRSGSGFQSSGRGNSGSGMQSSPRSWSTGGAASGRSYATPYAGRSGGGFQSGWRSSNSGAGIQSSPRSWSTGGSSSGRSFSSGSGSRGFGGGSTYSAPRSYSAPNSGFSSGRSGGSFGSGSRGFGGNSGFSSGRSSGGFSSGGSRGFGGSSGGGFSSGRSSGGFSGGRSSGGFSGGGRSSGGGGRGGGRGR